MTTPVPPTVIPVTPIPTPVVTPLPAVTPATSPSQLAGTWYLQAILFQGATAPLDTNVQITAIFSDQGQVSGYGGCNNYGGPYMITGQNLPSGTGISIGPLTSTQMVLSGREQHGAVLSDDIRFCDQLHRFPQPADDNHRQAGEFIKFQQDTVFLINQRSILLKECK